jgi:hypothetical protein
VKPLHRTCKKLEPPVLLKTTLFQQFYIAQIKAQSPTPIRALTDFSIPLSQFPNILVTLAAGGGILKVK